jgi:stringent starvation protein A
MASVASTRRSVMTLFSDPTGLESHRVRMVLAEKGINVEIVDVVGDAIPEDLIDLNPYNTVPTLIDRELVLHEAQVIMEYLDERFPHPPLMPVDPVSRAQFRSAFFELRDGWFQQAKVIETGGTAEVRQARKELREALLASADGFGMRPFFLSDEFSLMDCSVAPLLWRLPRYGIELGGKGKHIIQYAKRVFLRPSFAKSLTELEREMRGN